uniref:Uncharacterized protein n=1 Tax=Anas platyrhynchos platyrhynchos TaxID=8840 RepID=A0A493SWW5_ANAPP
MQTLPRLDVPEAQSGIPRATHNPVSKGALGACISSRPHPAELSQAHHLLQLTSLGSREMKSLWNCGSMTCIMYLICEGSQRSMSSSRASSFSGPLHPRPPRAACPAPHPGTATGDLKKGDCTTSAGLVGD